MVGILNKNHVTDAKRQRKQDVILEHFRYPPRSDRRPIDECGVTGTRMVKDSVVGSIFCLAVISSLFTTAWFSLNIDRVIPPTQHVEDYLDSPSLIKSKFKTSSEVDKAWILDDSSDDSFSACILWMDDNHQLEEWLAYHYYLLKLRYVVVNIDPQSRTSPKAIIDRWNDRENKYNLNMTIVTMSDKDYVRFHGNWMRKIRLAKNASSNQEYLYGKQKTDYHRSRQHQFYKACSKHLVQQNKSWTSYHDTDEYLMFAHELNGKDIAANSTRKMKKPGYVLHRLNSIKKQFPPNKYVNETGASCLIIPRRRYCAKELSTEDTNDLFVPSPDNTTGMVVPEGFMNSSIDTNDEYDRQNIVRRFATLRYKYLTPGTELPKSIIDLSQPDPRLYIQDQWHTNSSKKHKWHPHRPMHALCTKEDHTRARKVKKTVNQERFFFGHYLGSFEAYAFRNDFRKGGIKTYNTWETQANETEGEFSHVIRPWLNGFVELVGGPDVASYLLQDAGIFPADYDAVSRMKEYNTTYDYFKGVKAELEKK